LHWFCLVLPLSSTAPPSPRRARRQRELRCSCRLGSDIRPWPANRLVACLPTLLLPSIKNSMVLRCSPRVTCSEKAGSLADAIFPDCHWASAAYLGGRIGSGIGVAQETTVKHTTNSAVRLRAVRNRRNRIDSSHTISTGAEKTARLKPNVPGFGEFANRFRIS
jgi:hypothetical protein